MNPPCATLTSWKVDGQEMLFLSKKSLQDGKSPIRGGIPLVFPNFGAWELGPHHGFAHTSLWSVQPSDEMQEGNVGKAVILSLEDNDCTRSIWNHGFRLVYRIELQKAKLRLELTVENTGTSTFEFTTLMHPYWRMEDVRKCTLSGCHGVLYADKTKDFCELREEREYVTISQWTDNIYKSTERVHMLTEVGTGKTLKIEKENLPDTGTAGEGARMWPETHPKFHYIPRCMGIVRPFGETTTASPEEPQEGCIDTLTRDVVVSCDAPRLSSGDFSLM
ncbi:uncharacterized protein LOC119180580 isoform X5 [Rhipicephalus microplus]|uniref:uncharacterized protein LOC119180580 isoform X5 n=1 Tax=Rhipicephalus microplus TaxID=6941 RepID=UPI003F6A7F5C